MMNYFRNERHLYESLTIAFAVVLFSSSALAQNKTDPHEIYKKQNQSVTQENTRQMSKTFIQSPLETPPKND